MSTTIQILYVLFVLTMLYLGIAYVFNMLMFRAPPSQNRGERGIVFVIRLFWWLTSAWFVATADAAKGVKKTAVWLVTRGGPK